MKILESYVDRMCAGDVAGTVALFTKDCHFNDGGARVIEIEDLIVDGRDALEAALFEVMKHNKVNMEIVKLNPNSMEYDVFLGDIKLECIGCATVKDGLISEYVVRPR